MLSSVEVWARRAQVKQKRVRNTGWIILCVNKTQPALSVPVQSCVYSEQNLGFLTSDAVILPWNKQDINILFSYLNKLMMNKTLYVKCEYVYKLSDVGALAVFCPLTGYLTYYFNLFNIHLCLYRARFINVSCDLYHWPQLMSSAKI